MADPIPASDIEAARWRELQAALTYVNMADFEAKRGDIDAASMWLDDARRALGGVALLLSDGPEAQGYAHLLRHIFQEGPTDAAQP